MLQFPASSYSCPTFGRKHQPVVCLTDRRTLQHLTLSNGSCSRLVLHLDGQHRPVDCLTDHRTPLLRFRRPLVSSSRAPPCVPSRASSCRSGREGKKNCSLFVSLCCESSVFLSLLKRFAPDSTSRRFV